MDEVQTTLSSHDIDILSWGGRLSLHQLNDRSCDKKFKAKHC
jgi:hypothetical protein